MLFVQRARHAAAALAKTPVHARTLASLPDQGPEVVSGLQPSKVDAMTRAKSNFVRPRLNRDLTAIAGPPARRRGGARRRRGNLACTRLTARRRPRSSASRRTRASSPSAPAP